MKNKEKNIVLDEYEQEIEDALAMGSFFEVVEKDKVINALAIAAKERAKTSPITLRVNRLLLNKIKASAMREGLPYQTYISLLLHKNVA